MDHQYVSEVPGFKSLVCIKEAIDDVMSCLEGLAEGGDVVQRASDLLAVTNDLAKLVKDTVVED